MKEKQLTFSDYEYSNRRKGTRREYFLRMMDEIIPWQELVEYVRPFYPSGKRGRPPRGIETMLRMYFLQNWYRLSGPGVEDVVYDSYAMRSFLRVDFISEQVPDATTLLRFRHILTENDLEERILGVVDACCRNAGFTIRKGQLTDAAMIGLRNKADKNVEEIRKEEINEA